MLFLSRRPYHAFTQREIAEAVSAEGPIIAAEAIGDHIATLREQLGVLHDFVQTVPQVGYRFKA
jgi:DNA-binding response OmpR family regulator